MNGLTLPCPFIKYASKRPRYANPSKFSLTHIIKLNQSISLAVSFDQSISLVITIDQSIPLVVSFDQSDEEDWGGQRIREKGPASEGTRESSSWA